MIIKNKNGKGNTPELGREDHSPAASQAWVQSHLEQGNNSLGGIAYMALPGLVVMADLHLLSR